MLACMYYVVWMVKDMFKLLQVAMLYIFDSNTPLTRSGFVWCLIASFLW